MFYYNIKYCLRLIRSSITTHVYFKNVINYKSNLEKMRVGFLLAYAIFIIISYLLGSIPFALIVGKVGYNLDIREHGSGNMGATNAFRVMGTKAGILVTIADILKGTVATLIPLLGLYLFDIEVSRLIIGLFAVIGHTY